MRKLLSLVLGSIGLSLTVAAPVAAQAMPTADAAKEKKICRRQEVTGSFIGSKAVCHTKAEWASIDEANSNAASDSLRRQRETRPSRQEL